LICRILHCRVTNCNCSSCRHRPRGGNPILEEIVSLKPVPGFTEPAGNSSATFAAVLVNHLDDAAKVGLGQNFVAVGEEYVHENERYLFFCGGYSVLGEISLRGYRAAT
jgi:hypothetical protein